MDYNKLLEKARKTYSECVTGAEKRRLESIFPELKESEDERIRKEIIDYLKSFIPHHDDDLVVKSKVWIAWLEKQGEQKPADKIEPWFRVGDWVVYETEEWREVLQIKTIESGSYTFTNGSSSSFAEEQNMRFWTIEDAKDGDVLISKYEQPFIYNGIFDDFSVGGFCGIDSGGFVFTIAQDNHKTWTANENIKPANTEQRILLFSKMGEAGYEWNAKKKELKKIEKNSDDSPKSDDYVIDGLWHAKTILEKTLGKVEGYQSDDGFAEHECAINAVKKLYEQKPTWSEEDEQRCRYIIDFYLQKAYGATALAIEWLENLKYRVGPQQKPDWSEDDELMLTSTINSLKSTNGACDMKIEWLKSLKGRVQPQQKQEWSDEDEKMMQCIHKYVKSSASNFDYENIQIWFRNIKNRVQPQWKPTDGQMQALELVVQYHAFADQDKREKIVALFNDLKKL